MTLTFWISREQRNIFWEPSGYTPKRRWRFSSFRRHYRRRLRLKKSPVSVLVPVRWRCGRSWCGQALLAIAGVGVTACNRHRCRLLTLSKVADAEVGTCLPHVAYTGANYRYFQNCRCKYSCPFISYHLCRFRYLHFLKWPMPINVSVLLHTELAVPVKGL